MFYDDESAESETALVVTEKMGNLKFENLIYKIKSEKKVESEVDSAAVAFARTQLDSAPASPCIDTNGNGYKTKINLVRTGSGNETTTKETVISYGPNQQRSVMLIGRTGSGKSLLGCVLLGKYLL